MQESDVDFEKNSIKILKVNIIFVPSMMIFVEKDPEGAMYDKAGRIKLERETDTPGE